VCHVLIKFSVAIFFKIFVQYLFHRPPTAAADSADQATSTVAPAADQTPSSVDPAADQAHAVAAGDRSSCYAGG
jgi:hypothetical protein